MRYSTLAKLGRSLKIEFRALYDSSIYAAFCIGQVSLQTRHGEARGFVQYIQAFSRVNGYEVVMDREFFHHLLVVGWLGLLWAWVRVWVRVWEALSK